jgi:predicted aconitase with swiveling domain
MRKGLFLISHQHKRGSSTASSVLYKIGKKGFCILVVEGNGVCLVHDVFCGY